MEPAPQGFAIMFPSFYFCKILGLTVFSSSPQTEVRQKVDDAWLAAHRSNSCCVVRKRTQGSSQT
jgi:hypothetical protein